MFKIALVGQPNCGKTTIFNFLTKSNQHVGNWPGVTVEKKEGFLQIENFIKEEDKYWKNKNLNKLINIIDLPGIYSLSSLTLEEKITRDFLMNEKPDLIINVIDSNNIQRNLFLTFQLLMLNLPLIIVLNFIDELNNKNIDINENKLSSLINCKIIKTNARNKIGLEKLAYLILDYIKNENLISKNYNIEPRFSIPIEDSNIKKSIENISKILFINLNDQFKSFSLFLSFKFLENDDDVNCFLKKNLEENIFKKLENNKKEFYSNFYNDDFLHIWIYSIISGIEKEIIVNKVSHNKKNYFFSPDKILLNNILGIPLFFIIILIIFFLTFKLGDFFSQIFENLINILINLIENNISNNLIKSIIADGIIAGIGNVIFLVPYIFIMFFLLGFLEDIGYIPRISFLFDKFFHKLGLHGKSFIPLILGFGCNVPAIMGTRTLEKKDERIKTILMIPLISCSGRLPIYLIFTAAFFSRYEALIIFSLYFIGILTSIFTGLLLNKTALKQKSEGLIIELPPYRLPTLKNLLFYTIPKIKDFLKKAGSLIFIFTIFYWFLVYLPSPEFYGTEKSLAGKIAKIISPLFKPLGFDWKLSISLITGFFAKELVISSLGVIYANEGNLLNVLPLYYSPLIAYTFLIFVSLYIPCLATIFVIKNETKSLFWTLFSIIYPIIIAWIVSFIILNILKLIL